MYSKVIQCFTSQVLPWTKLIPFGRPRDLALYSEQLRILNRQRKQHMMVHVGGLNCIHYSKMVQETSPEVKRGQISKPTFEQEVLLP